MARVRFVNASPLITLAKVGRLDLLSGPGVQLVIPEAVAEEVLAGPEGDPAEGKGCSMRIESIRLKNFKAFRDVHVRDIPAFCVLVGANGSGKAELLT